MPPLLTGRGGMQFRELEGRCPERKEEQKQAPCSDFVFTWQLRVLCSRWENKDKGVREAAEPWKPQDTVESAAQQDPLWAEADGLNTERRKELQSK